jgi:type I restriction enzyme R subunit
VGEDPAGYAGAPIDEPRKELVSLIEEAVASHTAIVDWVHKEDVQREARAQVKRQLRAARFPQERIETLANEIVDLMKARRG